MGAVIEKPIATEDDKRIAKAVLEPLTDRQRRAVYRVLIEAWEAESETASTSDGQAHLKEKEQGMADTMELAEAQRIIVQKVENPMASIPDETLSLALATVLVRNSLLAVTPDPSGLIRLAQT